MTMAPELLLVTTPIADVVATKPSATGMELCITRKQNHAKLVLNLSPGDVRALRQWLSTN
jgi:hypothetical protein